MALFTAITIAIALFIDLFFLPTLLITLEKFNLLKNSSFQSKNKSQEKQMQINTTKLLTF